MIMAANGESLRPPAARERPPAAIEEIEDGFYISNNHGKLRRVPEDWKSPPCPLATKYELCLSGDESRGMSRMSPLKMHEKPI
jgi:hypothetical protein